jgi:hypothetical protein
MTDFIKDIVQAHFALLFGTAVAFVLLALLLALKLFQELRTDPTATRKALLQELFFISKLRLLLSRKPPEQIIAPDEPNPLAQTGLPMPAVKDPRTTPVQPIDRATEKR